ncbi:MAG: carboxymuconolactone decarboxylase family protein [Alphaproteobacteria bacterium]|nr:carboxymuconolactone decarboxylase family protein [Alphaproteobacteria bacterium]
MAELSDHQRNLKAEFIENRGYWFPFWQQILEMSPEFFETYCNFSSVPWKTGPLQPKIKEMIYIAMDIATTHLYLPGTRIHMANALKHGATKEELMEVLQIVSVLGIHSMTEGLPILVDELQKADMGGEIEAIELDERALTHKQEFIDNRGYWMPIWETLLKLSPDFFKAYLDLSSVPWKTGVLEPKIKELIYVAIDIATTHLFLSGTRIHMRNALKHGATKDEIMEVIALVSICGMHSATEGVPILVEELDRFAAAAE